MPTRIGYYKKCNWSTRGLNQLHHPFFQQDSRFLIKIIFNNNEIGKNDRDPKLVLELGLLSYLLIFNKEVSEKYNTHQNKSFFDLEIDSLGQNNVLILGKVISDKGNYVGYYGIDNKTGYLFHNISNNFDDALDFYIERYPNKEPKNK